MKLLNIGVVIPTHPKRVANGMTERAFTSVMQQKHPAQSISVYNDYEGRGAPYSRHQALMSNNCEWTAFLDSDDWFMPEHLEVLATAQRETGADYVYAWYELIRFNRSLGAVDPVFPTTHYTEPWDNNNPRQTTMTVLVRTDLAKEVGFWDVSDEENFPDGHRKGEDYVFTLGCMDKGAKIHHVVQRTWYWHHHGLNTSGRAGQGDAV